MTLIIIWIIFILFISTSQEFSQLYYFLVSGLMLGFTYLYNQMNFINFSLKSVMGFLTIPSILFGYLAFVYNNFLSLTPIEHEASAHLAVLYFYVIFYIYCKDRYDDVDAVLLENKNDF